MVSKVIAGTLCLVSIVILGCGDDNTTNPPQNKAPDKPLNPSPSNGALDQSTSPLLSWQCSDPDANDVLTYDVYLDSMDPPAAIVSANQSDTFFATSNLDVNTTYFWKIRAKDQHKAATSSDVWNFKTQPIPTAGLIAYYPFNGNADDESGNGHNGVVTGSVLTPDRFGNADRSYLFDGINDYISVPYSPDMNAPRISISVWARLSRLVGVDQARIVNRQSTPGGIESWGVQVFGNNYSGLGNYNKFTFHSANCALNKNLVSPTHLTADTWYHVVAVHDGVTLRLYINSLPDTLDSSLGDVCVSNLSPIVIGRTGPMSMHYFPGAIDDIRIYNRALNLSEIDALYEEGGYTQ